MKDKLIRIDKKDNVAVALSDINAGEELKLNKDEVHAAENINKNFKVALKDINKGETIIKYGFPIGIATQNIKAGCVVHSHNMKSMLEGVKEYDIKLKHAKSNMDNYNGKRTFKGYLRSNGEVGIRNEIFVLPTVGCVNEVCQAIAQKAIIETGKQDVFVFKHPYGCSQLGDDMVNTQKILSGLAHHPNAGGVLIVSLGCENNNLNEFKKVLGAYDDTRVRFLLAQDSGDEITQGVQIIKELVDICYKDVRQDADISKLNIGLKCGGSDALSGITANPLVGKVCDVLSSLGAGVIMIEVPEMFGAEHILMERSKNDYVKNDIINMVNNFKDYFISHGESVEKNPSPGNKEGGITTLEEKSLGCIQKGGKATINAVLPYGDVLSQKGLNLLEGPGNDIVAQTALTVSGAHIILFTTGRGTPLGAPVPTIKISTNSQLFNAKPNWIDFDAGRVLNEESFETLCLELIDMILMTAQGQNTKNEINGYREIAIWKNGVTL